MTVSPNLGSPPPGLAEGHIQLPVDGSGKMLRAFPLTTYEQQPDGTFAAVTSYQQVLVIADADGNLLGVDSSPLKVESSGIELLLAEIRDVMVELKHFLSETN